MKKILFLILIINSFNSNAQKKSLTKTEAPKTDHGYTIGQIDKNYGAFVNFHSDTMNKDFPMLVFLPNGYKESKKEFPVIYSLHGYNNAKLTEDGLRAMMLPETGCQEAANEYQVIIVCPLVGNHYYIDSPIYKERKFATLIGVELVRFVEQRYRAIKDRKYRILQGFSMGGYGAVSLLCRYPETFSTALSRGGALFQQALIDDLNWDDASLESLGDFFENPKIYHQHSIVNLLNKIKERTDVAIVLEVGREDFLYTGNQKVNEKLKTCKFPFIFAEYPGGHVWSKNALHSMLVHLQYFVKTKN
ncbi:MAG: hypothetical protein EAZ07_02745 [Cytophagales bacterium]|nr:MAG: hypothetical protein EAZ07_02745 [Cytophagales bacterium]